MSKRTDLLIKEIRDNLISNLWKIIDNKPIDIFKFGEFLTDKFIQSGKQVKFIDISTVYEFAMAMEKEYANLLDYISFVVGRKDILEIQKYIKQQVNGNFTYLIKEFVIQHDKKNQEVN